jgi:hypothetical protein
LSVSCDGHVVVDDDAMEFGGVAGGVGGKLNNDSDAAVDKDNDNGVAPAGEKASSESPASNCGGVI